MNKPLHPLIHEFEKKIEFEKRNDYRIYTQHCVHITPTTETINLDLHMNDVYYYTK